MLRLALLFLVIAPFFTSFLIRTLSWKILLGDNGPLLSGVPTHEAPPSLEPVGPLEELALDAHYGGAFPGTHPMALARPRMKARGGDAFASQLQ